MEPTYSWYDLTSSFQSLSMLLVSNFGNEETRLKRDWYVAELSLEPRCLAFECQTQAALFTRFLINHFDICASPLPARLPTSFWSFLRSKAGSGNTFCSGCLWKARSEGLVTVKHNGDEAFLFYLTVATQAQHETVQSGFIVFLQYDTFSHFKLMLSPTVCHNSVANLLDLYPTPPKKGHCLPLLFWSFALLTFIQLITQMVQSTIFRENSFVQDTWLDPGENLEMSKKHSCLSEAYNLVLFFY